MLSTYGDTEDHGLLDWYRDLSPDVVRLHDVEDAARLGVHRLITPYRAIQLVHAVQQPIGYPSIERYRIKPQDGALAGYTFVDFDSEFWTHSLSTVKLDVIGAWTQNVDEPSRGQPPSFNVPYQQTVLEQIVPLESDDAQSADKSVTYNYVSESVGITRITRHELRDTKYRHVQYRLQGITRFGSIFHRMRFRRQQTPLNTPAIVSK